MKLTTTLCAIALLTTQAAAEGVKPEPVKPPVVTHELPSTDSGTDWLLPLLVVIAGVVIVSRSQQPDDDAPRPLVEPDICMDKRGVFVACEEE